MIQRNQAAATAPRNWLPQAPVHASRTDVVRAEQRTRNLEPCFMSQKRLLCDRTGCEWRNECRRLVAAWKR
jgi:hypothetical protein